MTLTKEWYRSKTVWGGLIALAGAIAGLFGLEASPEASEAAVVALTDAATAIGALIAIVGRFEASASLR